MAAITRAELIAELVERGAGDKKHVGNMLNHLRDVVAEEVAMGEDLILPGIVKFAYDYRPPKKKGERWKKGDKRVNNITKEETVAEADSPPVKPRIRLQARPVGAVGKAKPSTNAEKQAVFMKTNAGKYIIKRKAK